MNWHRGLFRVWVVASTIWVLFICIVRWDRLSEVSVAIEPPAGQGAVFMDWGPYACWVTRNPDNPFALMNSAPGPTTLT